MIKQDEILRFIDNDRTSKRKQQARLGMRYYNGDHDIKNYKMYYYDGDGALVEDKHRTNVKIPHQFFAELVNQATDYLMSGDGAIVRSENADLQKELDGYFGNKFRHALGDCITHMQISGFAYMYRYIDSEKRSRFVFADGGGVVEVKARLTSDGNDYVIYYYNDTMMDDNKQEIAVERVQVWDNTQTHYYINQDGKLKKDPDAEVNPRPHVIYNEGDTQYGEGLGAIPFYRVDNNREQKSDIHAVKALIDDYDIHACSLTNDIQDFSSVVYFVKGMQGQDLNEFITNVKTKKAVGVAEGGGVDVKTVDIPYEARKVKLEHNERKIYKFGHGFDSNNIGDGNVTNVVIKSRYTLLDLKGNKIERNVRNLLDTIIEIVLDEINQANDTGYTAREVKIEFARNFIANELDNAQIALYDAQRQKYAIDALLSSSPYLGDEKVLEQIGVILNVDVSGINLDTIQAHKLNLDEASDALLATKLQGEA